MTELGDIWLDNYFALCYNEEIQEMSVSKYLILEVDIEELRRTYVCR